MWYNVCVVAVDVNKEHSSNAHTSVTDENGVADRTTPAKAASDDAANDATEGKSAADADDDGDDDHDDDDDELNLLNEDDVAKLARMTVTVEQHRGITRSLTRSALYNR